MDVTVTIASWNRADLLERCLQSVLKSQGGLEIEIIVVDNASTDHCVQMVQERFPSVQLIANKENRGFGKAHNQAIAKARGRYVLILNNDAVVLPDTIASLVTFMDGRPRAGVCTCPASNGSGWMTGGGMKYFPSVGRDIVVNLLALVIPPMGWPGRDRIISWLQLINGNCPPHREQQVAWCKGALLVVRRSMLGGIVGFDERFFMYHEDVDFCFRANRAGWALWQTDVTSYLHDSGQSTALRGDRDRIWTDSGSMYFQKHHGRLWAMLWRGQDLLLRRGIPSCRYYLARVVKRRAGLLGSQPVTSGSEVAPQSRIGS